MSNRNKKKIITAGLNSVMIASSIVAPLSNSKAQDEEKSNDSLKFKLINNDTGFNFSPTDSMKVEVYSDSSKKYVLDGDIITENGYLEFKSKSSMPENKEYLFKVLSDEFDDFEGKASFSNSSYEIKLSPKKDDKPSSNKSNDDNLKQVKEEAVKTLISQGITSPLFLDKIRNANTKDGVYSLTNALIKSHNESKAKEDELKISSDDLTKMLKFLNDLDLSNQESEVKNNIEKAKNIISSSKGVFDKENRSIIANAFNNIDRDRIKREDVKKISFLNDLIKLFNVDDLSLNERSKPAKITFNFFKNTEDGEIVDINNNDISFFNEKDEKLDLSLNNNVLKDFKDLDFQDKIKIKIKKDGFFECVKDINLSKDPKEEKIVLKEIPEVNINVKNVNKIYGDDDFSLSEYLDYPNDYKGKISYEIVNGNEYVELNGDKVKVRKPGKTIIKYIAEKTDKYKESSGSFEINIAKRDLGVIEAKDIEWENLKKIYDGKSDFTIKGKIKESVGLVKDDSFDISAEIDTEDKDVGKKKSVINKVEINNNIDDYYTYEINKKGPIINIAPLNIELGLSPITVEYGKNDWKNIKRNRKPKDLSLTDLLSINSSLESDLKDEFNELNLDKNLSISFKKDKFNVGEVKNGYEINIKNKNIGNFTFDIKDLTQSVKIVSSSYKRDEILNNIMVDKENSENIFINKDQLYAAPGSKITFKLKDNQLYDKVNLKSVGAKDGEEYSDHLIVPMDKEDGYLDSYVYLSRNDSIETRTNEVLMRDKEIEIDSDAPTVKFKDGLSGYGFFNKKDSIKFTNDDEILKFTKRHSKEGYTINIDVNDEKSGVKNKEYSIVKVNSDKEASDLLKNIKSNTDIKWNKLYKDNIKISGTKDGYYLILIKTSDNLGNESIYASNGVAIDITAPRISIEGFEDKLYTKNIDYKLTVADKSDNNEAYTGINKVKVNVYDGLHLINSYEENTNTFVKEKDDLYKNKYNGDVDTFEEFKKLSEPVEINGHISANSNNIRFEVEVEDNAGNVVSKKILKHIRIDKTDAKVYGSFDNNNARNEKYFNKDRVLNLKIIERNYIEDNLFFDIGINGKNKEYSLADLKNGLAKGVEIVEDNDDSEKTSKEHEFTDDRTNSYKILFGGKNKDNTIDYDLDIYYMDNGKKIPISFDSSQIASKHFTIDEIAPILNIEFYNEKDKKENIGENKKTPFYTQSFIKPKLMIKEKNFDKKDVELHLSSKDSSGKIRNDAYNIENILEANKREWTKSEDLNYFFLNPFEKDSNYGLSMEYTDLAGNKAEIFNFRYFTIDKNSPDAKIKAIYEGKEVDYTNMINKAQARGAVKNFIFNLFGKNDIRFKNESYDETSGIKNIKYYIEYINNDSKNYESVADLENLGWKDLGDNDTVVVRADLAGVLYERIEDKAGNITYISSNGAFVRDSKNPSKPKIEISDGVKKIYNEDVSFNIKATDPDNGGKGVYSGIRYLSYIVRDNLTGKITQKDTLVDFKTYNKSRKQAIIKNISIDSSKSNSNDLSLEVYVEDYAGNSSYSSKDFSIDSTKPTIKAIFDNSNVKNGKYFNTTREAIVNINERNFVEENTKMALNINGSNKEFSFSDIRDGKAKQYGIELISVSDSQRNENSYTDGRLISYRILFGIGENIDYEYGNISINTIDKAGNISKENGDIKDFVVDKIIPSINVSYYNGKDVTNNVTTNRNIPLYSQTSITPTVTINDKRFRREAVGAILEQFDGKGRKLNRYRSLSSLNNGSWINNGDNYKFSMPSFDDDGIYGLLLSYEDLAGNKAKVYDARYFSVDKTAPSGSIGVFDNKTHTNYNALSETARFKHISNRNVTLSQTADDDISGIASVSYYIYKPDLNARGDFHILSINELRNVPWTNWKSDINLSSDEQVVVYQRIMDRAGNITYKNTQGAIIIDKNAPFNPNISINKADNKYNIHNKNVPINIDVKDNIVNNSYSGLKRVTIEIYNGRNKTQSQIFNVSNIENRQRVFNTGFTIDSKLNNSNNIKVRVIVEDNAGNIANSEKILAIDITPPKIEVIYDVEASANKKYYNKGRVATIKVYERNFDPSLFNLKITGAKADIGRWQLGNQMGVSDNNLNVLKVHFREDGEYNFTFDLIDKAGNKTNYNKTDNFIVDQTKPTIDLQFDKSLVNGKYINSTRVGTITVKEVNFDAKDFESKISATLNSQGIKSPSISSWSNNGNIHKANITFSDDGDYKGVLNYKDLAGNNANEVKINEFTVDKKAPKINFEKVENKMSYRDKIKPEIVLEDENYDKDSIDIRLIGKRHKEVKINGSYISGGSKKGKIVVDNFPIDKKIDDIYTLKVSNKDKAENKTEKEVQFSVNRFGSNYYYSKNTSKFLKKFYNKKEEDLEIFEINPDELKEQSITINYNGASKKLNKKAYRIDKNEKDGWNEYKYTINADNFKKEGVYEIFVNSKDQAGNVQSNKIKESPARFVIDKTNPSGVITGVENNTVYDDLSRNIVIKAEDNNELEKVSLLVDGNVVATFNKKEIKNNNGNLPCTLKEKGRWQKVKAVMKDSAGNVSETDELKVLISSNTFTRLINNKKIIFGGLAFLIGLLSLIFFLIKRRKKDKDE